MGFVEVLKEELDRSGYCPGDPLPSERQLAASYGVSRATVRRALNHLHALGLVFRNVRKEAVVDIGEHSPLEKLLVSQPELQNDLDRFGKAVSEYLP